MGSGNLALATLAMIRSEIRHFSLLAGQQRTFDFAIGSLQLPPRIQDFLEQYSWNLENRLCPLERERQKIKNERGG